MIISSKLIPIFIQFIVFGCLTFTHLSISYSQSLCSQIYKRDGWALNDIQAINEAYSKVFTFLKSYHDNLEESRRPFYRLEEKTYRKDMTRYYDEDLKSAKDTRPISLEAYILIRLYRGSLYLPLNSELRSGHASKEAYTIAKGLDAALRQKQASTFQGTTYRVINLPDEGVQGFLEKYQDDAIVTEPFHISTSKKIFKTWDTNVIFIIKGHSGVDISFQPSHITEVLFPTDVRFKCKIFIGDPQGHLPDKNIKWTVELEEIN